MRLVALKGASKRTKEEVRELREHLFGGRGFRAMPWTVSGLLKVSLLISYFVLFGLNWTIRGLLMLGLGLTGLDNININQFLTEACFMLLKF